MHQSPLHQQSELEAGLADGRGAEILTRYQRLLNDPTQPYACKAEIFSKLGCLCKQMRDFKRARNFFDLALYANPSNEAICRLRLSTVDTGSLPTRTFSVVMPTFNRHNDLVQCIDHIRHNAFFPTQIIVICDKCEDGTMEFIQSENRKEDFVGVINDKRLGSVPSLKLGLYLAEGDYVAIINDDVQVMPGWDVEVVSAVDADADAGCAVPLVVSGNGTVQSVGQHNPYLSTKFGWVGQVPVCPHEAACGRNLLEFTVFHQPRQCDYGYFPVLKRRCLQKIGFVDDHYRHYFVDPDIGYAIQKEGWKSIFCPTSVFVHHHRSLEELGERGMQLKAQPDMKYFIDKWGLIMKR
jgi:hypothetical protein